MSNPKTANKAYLTYSEVSAYTGLPKGTLYSLVSAKRIPHVRLSRRMVLFKLNELDAWLQEHRVECRAAGTRPRD